MWHGFKMCKLEFVERNPFHFAIGRQKEMEIKMSIFFIFPVRIRYWCKGNLLEAGFYFQFEVRL